MPLSTYVTDENLFSVHGQLELGMNFSVNQKVKHRGRGNPRTREKYTRALFEKKVGGAKSFREKPRLPYGIRISEEKKKGEEEEEEEGGKKKFIRGAP